MAGSDIAIEFVDVAHKDDDLHKIAHSVRLSRATYFVVTQDIALALGLKLVFLILTLMGLATLWMAVFADMATSLLVVANGPVNRMENRQYAEVEGHHGVEMIATAEALTFHLTDDEKPIDLTGAQFEAIVQTDAGITSITLSVEGNFLKAPQKAPLPIGAKVVISGKDRHGHTLHARFVKQ